MRGRGGLAVFWLRVHKNRGLTWPGQEMVPYDISRQRIFWAGYKADLGRVNTGQNSLALEGPLQ